ncbi:MAG: nucleotidyltransferase family protein [Deltaproteobacteria bacterium]|nr:nucleotidyltransferase family protein [Deltaproteobacteria bacterium]
MRALLLAAGLGTRLRPITDKIPKCLVPICGKPLLGYWLDLLLPNGIDRILINTHYLPGAVHSYIASSPWKDSIELVHEHELLGTGGAVLRNRNFFRNESFLVTHADNLTRFDTLNFLKAHACRPSGVEITMMTFDTDIPKTCGIVEQDEHGIVTAFHEKSASPPGNRANAAVYIFEPPVLDFLAGIGREVIDLSLEVLPHYVALRGIQTYHNTDYHRDIGSLESLDCAEREFNI